MLERLDEQGRPGGASEALRDEAAELDDLSLARHRLSGVGPMTIGSVGLAEIQQTLSEMQSASQSTAASPATGAGDEAFATSLAQATSDLSASGGLGGDDLFSEALDGGGSLGTADGLSVG